MRIAICIYGMLYGNFTNHDPIVKHKDFRHCWSNVKKYVVDSFVEAGHKVDVLVSTYKVEDPALEKEFFDLVQPKKVCYSDFQNSNTFTSKYASFNNLTDTSDYDFIILTRFDLHWNKPLCEPTIDYNKFNYLFPENDRYIEESCKHFGFTCDNVYMWPATMTPIIQNAMRETYRFPRGYSPDTHALKYKVASYIGNENVNAISNKPDFSHLNEYYTICKEGLTIHDINLVHPDVKERFNYA